MDELSYMAVARAVATHLADLPAADGAIGGAIRHLRDAARTALPNPSFTPRPRRDHAALLGMALAHARDPISASLASLTEALPWHYHYEPHPEAGDLADRIAFAEIIGPSAPLNAPGCRAGFTLMAPRTYYPLHAHPAVELYVVLSGHAEWTTPEASRIVPPGGLVLHRTDQPHAMRTATEPLLALYGWSGAIDHPAVYL
jgi:quercetin dioxygenase-like cupin family protein